MNTTKTLNDHRIDHVLSQKRNYVDDGGVQTRRDYLTRKLNEGSIPEAAVVTDHAAINKLQSRLSYLRNQGEPSGNPNWLATKEYHEIKRQLAEGVKKTVYRLKDTNGRVRDITKTEYEFIVAHS